MKRFVLLFFAIAIATFPATGAFPEDKDPDVEKALEIQKQLQETINKVKPAYVFFGRGGSAVCISPDGYCITNNHVAAGAARSQHLYSDFHFAGGKQYSGKIIWYDASGDLAYFKLDLEEGETVPFVKIGDSDALQVGEQAIAVGNPFSAGSGDWEPTVTYGVISALRRYKGWYSEAVQTDAPVNPGNSGGPLFNIKGEVVGINGMIEVDRNRGRVNVGVGYAVPATQIKRFIEFYKGKFEIGGKVSHGIVNGLVIDTVPLGKPGALVKDVRSGSTAEKAGFKAGDIITEIAGKDVLHPAHVQGVVHTYPAESEIVIKASREGETVEIKVKLDAQPQRGARTSNVPMPSPSSAFLGVGTQPYADGGLEVMSVTPDSGAEKAGIQVADIIKKLDGTEVNDSAAFGALIRKHKPGDKIKIVLVRDGEEKEIEVTLTARGNR
ncbi:MAG: trypsin-like peptidase domain-containing protein [Planctomycetota bacterium]|jgi:serine protease Do